MINTSDNKSNEQLRSKDLIYDMEMDSMNKDNNVSLREEFDQCIRDLQRQLQVTREERKKSQLEVKLLEHRVMLLHNQEKIAQQKYERTKTKFDLILRNRSLMNFLKKDNEVFKGERGRSLSRYSSSSKLQVSDGVKVLQQIRSRSKSKSKGKGVCQRNWKNLQLAKQQEEEEMKLKQEIIEKKMKMKEELLKRIKEDEDERMQLESQIADIEREEMKILKYFRKDTEEEAISKSYDMAYNSLRKQNEHRSPRKSPDREGNVECLYNNNSPEIHIK